jgi:hypothetical protein
MSLASFHSRLNVDKLIWAAYSAFAPRSASGRYTSMLLTSSHATSLHHLPPHLLYSLSSVSRWPSLRESVRLCCLSLQFLFFAYGFLS